MKRYMLLLFSVLCAMQLSAQNIKVTGTVRASDSEPLIGVSVTVEGTDIRAITDRNGIYTIDAAVGNILLFSYLGMVDKAVEVKNTRNIDIIMLSDTYFLDDVVVVGYGSMKKSDLTGAVASVKTDDLKNTKVGMASSALQGMAAGVQVTSGNLKPGADAGVIIRGAGSVNAGTSPLYIVDGVPMSGMQDLSTSDIESIEILKDASSAAIYGSRGSNGVVLVTTRRGEKGRGRVSFSASAGAQMMLNKQDMMNARQYYELVTASGQDYQWTTEELLLLSSGESTDWQDAVTQAGSFQNYNVSVSGGSDKISNYLGVDWYDQRGIIKNSSFNKLSLRYNMDSHIKPWLKAGARFNIVYSNLTNINEEADSGYGTMHSAVSSQPTAPIYASDGEYFDGFLNTKANPVAIVELLDKKTKKLMAVGSAYLEAEPLKNLFVRSENSVNYTSFRVNEYEDGRMGQHYPKEGRASIMSNLSTFMQTENTVTYNFEIEKHKMSVMGGFSASRNTYETSTAESKGLNPILKYNNLGGAEDHGPNSSFASASTLASFYGRLTYNYDERYLATVTMRGDGSSRFAPGHRWGFFPSVAFAWRISQESFLKDVKNVNNLKLRVSVGSLGNQNIGDYQFSALVSEGGYFNDYVFGGNLATGAVYSTIANSNLTWEKANQVDVGVDFGFFGGRLSGTVEGYWKRTSDLLWTVPLPYESGYVSSLTNVGMLDNKGIEFTLNTVNVNTGKFQWTSSFNFTWNHNNVVELYNGKQDVGKWIFVGHSLNEFYLLKSEGIWQLDEALEASKYGCVPGDRKIYDKDNNGVINGEDREFCGYSTPQFYGGFANTLSFAGFDLTVFLNYAGGHLINNGLLRYQNSYNVWGNMSVDYYENYWTMDRPSNKYPAPRIGSPYANGDGTNSNLQKGDYLRIKNLELGYTLPSRVTRGFGASSLRIYASVQNLYTFTSFTGYDVEAWDTTNTYPGARAFIGGISLVF